jgi:hypothetical protein
MYMEQTDCPNIPLQLPCLSQRGTSLYDISNNAIKHLRDDQYQLEYIINGSPETICNFENSYKVRASPDTFVRYYLAPPLKNNKANEYNFLISNDFTDYCFGKPIPDSKMIANPLIRVVTCGLGTPMDPTPVLDQLKRLKFFNKKLIPLSNSKLCVTTTKDFSNVNYETCHPNLEKRQTF